MKQVQTSEVLVYFLQRFLDSVQAHQGSLPVIDYDPNWLSSCQQGDAGDNLIYWQPVRRSANNDLSGIEDALEIKLHPDIKHFFTNFWSNHIDAIYQQGKLTLLFVCNQQDLDNLIKNQLGHALSKLKARQPLTFFIACTDTDYNICIENQTGQIVLERPGYSVEKILAQNLREFFDELEPGKLI